MSRVLTRKTDEWGLVSLARSGVWQVDLDEDSEGTVWTLELDSPLIYLRFQLRSPEMIRNAHDFLRNHREAGPSRRKFDAKKDEFLFGHFGKAPVSLLWDAEEIPRCFVLIGGTGRSAVRVCLGPEDISSLCNAFEEVARDLAASDNQESEE